MEKGKGKKGERKKKRKKSTTRSDLFFFSFFLQTIFPEAFPRYLHVNESIRQGPPLFFEDYIHAENEHSALFL